MNISRFFIDRPIFAGVLSIIIFLAGAIAITRLPVSEYPDVVPPSVVVRATYPGANPKVIAETVAAPLEEQINGVENLLYMSSQANTDGVLTLTVTFKIGTDPELAETQVQNRVQRALPRLPDEVRQIGVITQKSSPDLTMVVHIVSPDSRYDELYLRNYAVLNVKDVLQRIPGMGQVLVFGAGDYAMRVWLDPQKLSSRNLTATDVVQAIREQNKQVAAGVVGAPPAVKDTEFQLSVNAQGRLTTEEEFGNIIVATSADGGVLRLKDVARIELGAGEYALRSLLNNKPAVAIAIFQAPESNAIALSNDVRKAMADIKKDFPDGVDYQIVYDPTRFVKQSIEAVIHTLVVAILLVVLVVIVFLQTWRASIIPLAAVPVSIIGTFAFLLLFGFSINTLTLFGLVLAIGIVVDDAIVVVENVERNIELGFDTKEATYRAMREVSGPIIAIALTLCAVFVPIAFISGLTGEFYRQFALTIAISTVISAFNSLTLSPALAALLLRPAEAPKDALTRFMDRTFGWFFTRFDRFFKRSANGYQGAVARVLNRRAIAFAVYLVLIGLTYFAFQSVPHGFIPSQDKQYLVGFAQLPDGASLDRTEDVIRRMSDVALKTPGVRDAVAFPGLSINGFTNAPNAGIVFFGLDEFEKRKSPQLSGGAIAGEINKRMGGIQDAFIAVFPPPPVMGLGTIGGFKLQIEDRAGLGDEALYQAMKAVQTQAYQTPELAGVFSSFQINVPQLLADVDRAKAKRHGCRADRRVRHDADQSRIALRQRLQPLRPDLSRRGAGRRAVPLAFGGHRAAQDPQRQGRAGTARFAAEGRRELRAGSGDPLQRISFGGPQWRRGAGFQLRPGAGFDRADHEAGAAARNHLRVDRPHLSGDPRRQHRRAGLPAVRAAGVSRAGGAIRELQAAAGDHPDRAHVSVVRDHGGVGDPRRQQHLHPDRAVRADGARLQERDPDRRVRARAGIEGGGARSGPRRARSGAHPAAPDPDDVVRLHHGRGAAGLLHRCRIRDAACDGRGGVRRHARRDVLRALPYPGVLCAAASSP